MSSSVRDITESTEAEGRDDMHQICRPSAHTAHTPRPSPSPTSLLTLTEAEHSTTLSSLSGQSSVLWRCPQQHHRRPLSRTFGSGHPPASPHLHQSCTRCSPRLCPAGA